MKLSAISADILTSVNGSKKFNGAVGQGEFGFMVQSDLVSLVLRKKKVGLKIRYEFYGVFVYGRDYGPSNEINANKSKIRFLFLHLR